MALMDMIARSPLRRLTGRHTGILSYSAPTSGSAVELPIWAVPHGDGWLVAVGQHARKTWWRAFRAPLPARLDYEGRLHAVTGRVLTGPARDVAAAAYLKAVPMARRTVVADTPMVELSRRT